MSDDDALGAANDGAGLRLIPGSTVTICFWQPDDDRGQRAARHHAEAARQGPGFAGGLLLESEDGERIATYLVWSRPHAARAWARRAAEREPAAADADVFALAVSLPDAVSARVRATDRIALGEFWTTPDHQAALMAKEPEAAARAIALGGFRSVNFHRGENGRRVVNLAVLHDPAAVERLAATPGFSPDDGYWRGLARNAYHVYRVVQVLQHGPGPHDG